MTPAKVVLLLTESVLGADRVVAPLKLMALPLRVPRPASATALVMELPPVRAAVAVSVAPLAAPARVRVPAPSAPGLAMLSVPPFRVVPPTYVLALLPSVRVPRLVA